MAKNVLLKTGLCFVASLMITSTANAMTVDSEQGIAGLSYKIDQYFKKYNEDISDKFELGAQSVDDESTQEAQEVSEDDSKEKKASKERKAPPYDIIGISIAENYVRVRKKASTDSDIVGKL